MLNTFWVLFVLIVGSHQVSAQVTTEVLLNWLARPNLVSQFRDYTVHQQSSANKQGNNLDRLDGRDNEKEVVLAEMDGPGAIARLWTASANSAGTIRIYLDQNPVPVIAVPFKKMMDGESVYPFIKPLTRPSSGGAVSYFPIPYATHCKITIDNPREFYYQVTYLKFKPGTTVTTYKNMRLHSRDATALALEKASALWENPDKFLTLDSFAGRTIYPSSRGERPQVLYEKTGSGRFNSVGIRLTSPSLNNAIVPGRNLILRVYFDDHVNPDIEAPISDLLASPLSEAFRPPSLFAGRRPYSIQGADGQVHSGTVATLSLPMPFGKNARFSVENGLDYPVNVELFTNFTEEVFNPDTTGYLHAKFIQDPSVTLGVAHPWLHLKATRGHFVGVVQTMHGYGGLEFLEGDEQFRVDAEPPGQKFDFTILAPFNGTGTEDYFNSAYYFEKGPAIFPLHGITAKVNEPGEGKRVGLASAFRFHFLDSINFETSIDGQIEHSGVNDSPAGTYYASTVFWYSNGGVPDDARGPNWVMPYAQDIRKFQVPSPGMRPRP